LVELAFHATYLPGFCRFYHLGWNNLDDMVAALSPSLKMFESAKEKFKDIPFGDFQSAHWSPSAIKYEDVFLKED
jgi:hypothetical protein